MPFLQRYSNIKNGGIEFIGNTLGLSKAVNTNTAGRLGSIGAFISLDTALQVNDFPAGTTLDYTKNGSAALLNLPVNSTVLYAELVWGGLFRSSTNNISALLDNAITFRTPLGTNSVVPDAATKQDFNITINGQTLGFYVRTANVTSIVKAAKNGTYSTGSVPALIEAIDSRTSETNHAGWTLSVIYENASLPLRNLTLWSGGTVVSPAAGSTDITLTGFLTPEALPIGGKLFVSAQEGDAVIPGDRMLFGKTVAALSPISGPNNPVGNFFASQINNSLGLIETSGTFGSRNASASTATNTLACRQGWDITAVDVSSLLTTGMMTAAVRFTTDGDLYVPNCLALQIDSKGAQIRIDKNADKPFAEIGEEIGYSLNISNSGSIAADTVTVNDLLPAGTSLVPGSIYLNGVPYAGTLPVTFGPLAAGQSAIVQFKAQALALPPTNPILNTARTDYIFQPFPGYTVASSSFSDTVEVYIVDLRVNVLKTVDKEFAVAGEELFYTSVISNFGNIDLSGLVFKDPIPEGTVFLQNSVEINGVVYDSYDPSIGFPIPGLAKGQSVTITFKVIVK